MFKRLLYPLIFLTLLLPALAPAAPGYLPVGRIIAQDVQANNIIHKVDTIADLRLITGSPGRSAVQVLGYYAAGDGGGGPVRRWVDGKAVGYYTAVTGVEPDDGGSVIVPTGGDGSGAWVIPSHRMMHVIDFGAIPDTGIDYTSRIQAAVDSMQDGDALFFASGEYRITSTINLINKRGIRLTGESGFAWGSSGARLVWYGGNLSPIVKTDYFKQAVIENLSFISSDITTNQATASFEFSKDVYTSNGPVSFVNCRFDKSYYGVLLGSLDYSNNYNVSEVKFENCFFDTVVGARIAGVATGSQNVNIVFSFCQFGYSILEKGVWFDGGHADLYNCGFNASASLADASAIYITGDRSMTHPITMIGCYAEQINKIIETEYTASTTEWYRSAHLQIMGGYFHTNRGSSNEFITCYKNMSITLKNVEAVGGNITFSPPADSTQASFGPNAPASRGLILEGRNGLGSITTTRGGTVISFDRRYESTIPTGFNFPDTTTGLLTITDGGKDFLHQMLVLANGSNGAYVVKNITGGKNGMVIELTPQYSFRSFSVVNNADGTGNIRLTAGTTTTYLLNATTKKLILKKGSDGIWFEIGRQED
jgi:hypothetical protein